MSKPLPPLPSRIVVNDYLNIVPHNAQEYPINANANLARLWAEEVQRLGFNPDGVTFECFGKSQHIQVRDDGSVHIYA